MSSRSRAFGLVILMLTSLVLIPGAPLASATGSSVRPCAENSVWVSELYPSDSNEAWVELQTTSWDTCNLDGWSLHTGDANTSFSFDENHTLVPVWHTTLSNQSDATLLGSQNASVGEFTFTFDLGVSGDTISIVSPNSTVTSYTYPQYSGGGSYHNCIGTDMMPVWTWTVDQNRSSTPDDLNDCPMHSTITYPSAVVEWRNDSMDLWSHNPTVDAGSIDLNVRFQNLTMNTNYTMEMRWESLDSGYNFSNVVNLSQNFSAMSETHEWAPWTLNLASDACELTGSITLYEEGNLFFVYSEYFHYGSCYSGGWGGGDWNHTDWDWTNYTDPARVRPVFLNAGAQTYNILSGFDQFQAKAMDLEIGSTYHLVISVRVDDVELVYATEEFNATSDQANFTYDITLPADFCVVDVALNLSENGSGIGWLDGWYNNCNWMDEDDGPFLEVRNRTNDSEVEMDDFMPGNTYELKAMAKHLMMNETYTLLVTSMIDGQAWNDLVNVTWVAMNEWNQENFTLDIPTDACSLLLTWALTGTEGAEIHVYDTGYEWMVFCDQPPMHDDPDVRIEDGNGNEFEVEDVVIGENTIHIHASGFEPNSTVDFGIIGYLDWNEGDEFDINASSTLTTDATGNGTTTLTFTVPSGSINAILALTVDGYGDDYDEVWFVTEPEDPEMVSEEWMVELTPTGLHLSFTENWDASNHFLDIMDGLYGDDDGTFSATEASEILCELEEAAELFPSNDAMDINDVDLSLDADSIDCVVTLHAHGSDDTHISVAYGAAYTGTYVADENGHFHWTLDNSDAMDSSMIDCVGFDDYSGDPNHEAITGLDNTTHQWQCEDCNCLDYADAFTPVPVTFAPRATMSITSYQVKRRGMV